MARTAATTRSPAQMFALAFGVVYLLVGIIGFFVTPNVGFVEDSDAALLIFEVNPLHNIVHIVVALGYLGAARTHAAAKGVNLVFGVTFLALFVLGIFGLLEFLSINGAAAPDNWLHLATGLASVFFGTAGAEAQTTRRMETA